jgi:hypothetical protein
MTNKEEIDVKEALNEYFRLKDKFYNELIVNKKKIINNSTLSNREKRSEFLKLKPKCVNCKRPSEKGTIFLITYHESTDVDDSYRTFKAMCGNIADPCNLNIEIELGSVNSIEEDLNELSEDIKYYKNNIINDKNKLLFGLITTETALKNFETNKENISHGTSLYENYLDIWKNKTDNLDKKTQLDDTIVLSYDYIKQIKVSIKKMRENNDTQFAVDAANIYYNVLEPLLQKIRNLKYSENFVYHDDNDYCKLIQNKYSISDINMVSAFGNKIKAFDVGIKTKQQTKQKTKKKKTFIIESDESEEEKEREEKQNEPIIGEGKDGIEWNNPEYKKLWSKLPENLKNEFKLNIDWMKDFMNKCLNKPKNEPCSLTIPPNLIIPPILNETTKQYDFGVLIYNKVFNDLPQITKNTYLKLYKLDTSTKAKNYGQLENAMNNLVEQELKFSKVYL